MATQHHYPVRVEGHLEPDLSRGLWLVKWLLGIPHFIILGFLWIAFFLLTVIAFFGILFTGNYPRGIFDFNVGVLRWSWRVSYYSYGALGTDRYPPFTLAEVPDYPATLQVEYPQELSRGLVLVKWWLLAIPHYLIVGVFAGGGWLAFRDEDWAWAGGGGGLISILVLIAGLALLFAGRYPRGLFDMVMGLNRWVFRVIGYAALMTDQYPPFRLDLGETEEGPAPSPGTAPPAAGERAASGWTGGRIVALVVGSLMALIAMGLLAAGGVGLWADTTQRDDAGFLVTDEEELETPGYAIVSEGIDLVIEPDWFYPADILETVRVRATALDEGAGTFIGVGPEDDVAAYLSGVAHARIDDVIGDDLEERSGGAPDAPPGEQDFWVVSTEGGGRQTLNWVPEKGEWSIVVMAADGSEGVGVLADIGAELPVLTWIAVGLLIGGGVLLLLGGLLIGLVAARASRKEPAPATPPAPEG